MKENSKYWPLFQYLQQSSKDEVRLSFAQIETLGLNLPKSARERRAWWSNRNSQVLQSASWMEAGYHVEELDLEEEEVIFRKPVRVYRIERQGDTVMWDQSLIKALRYHLRLSQSGMAKELGVRQQTISDWETGVYRPKLAMSKYLGMVAEKADFEYGEFNAEEVER